MPRMKTAFSGAKSYRFLKHLTVGIGPRLTGGPGEHKAARYIAKVFRSFGLKTRLQKHTVPAYNNEKCVFEVLDKGKWRKLQCEPVMLTKSTPPGGIEADIFFLEAGEPEYFSPEMKGKIVLLCGGTGPHNRPLFLSYKPKAQIMIEGGVSDVIMRGFLRDDPKTYGNLPMARILHVDGLDIVKRGLTRARFTMRNTIKKSPSYNVIGEKRGTEFPDEIIVICAHYDSHMGIQGAADNAGGTAVMMELARIFSKEPARRTLRFVGFSGEETGLYGSSFYANDLYKKDQHERKKKSFNDKVDKTGLDKHRLTFNLDIHGCVLGSHHAMFNGVENIGASVRLLANETANPCGVSKGPMSSDGTPLAAVGIPNVQFARNSGSACCHTIKDEVSHLSPEGLARGGEFAELYLRRYVTQAVAFPFPREIPEDQKPGIKDYFKHGNMPMPGEKDEKKKS